MGFLSTLWSTAPEVATSAQQLFLIVKESAISQLTVFLVLTFLIRRRYKSITLKNNLPPSPAGAWPILGHLPLLASTTESDALLDKLSETLGPVYSLKLGTVTAVVISNDELARDSLIKRGKKYAGRWAGKVLMMSSDGGQDVAMVRAPKLVIRNTIS
jgi:hypothetical protein